MGQGIIESRSSNFEGMFQWQTTQTGRIRPSVENIHHTFCAAGKVSLCVASSHPRVRVVGKMRASSGAMRGGWGEAFTSPADAGHLAQPGIQAAEDNTTSEKSLGLRGAADGSR